MQATLDSAPDPQRYAAKTGRGVYESRQVNQRMSRLSAKCQEDKTMTTKKVLFLCGSPRRQRSASLCTAKFLARFLDYDYEFVDVAKAKLSTDPSEAEPAFLQIVEKMQTADAVVWTFGAWLLFVSVQMQYLLDKLFVQGYDFSGKVAASVMTSVRVQDDFILNRVRFVSEQLGFGYAWPSG